MEFPRLDLPRLALPNAPKMPVPTLELPSADIPRYTPLVLPPSDLRAPPGVKGGVNDVTPETIKPTSKPTSKPTIKPPEIRQITLPGTDVDVPLPTNEILVTAGTTAVVSVAATLTATAIFKRLVDLMKPIVKQVWTRLTKKKTSLDTSSDS